MAASMSAAASGTVEVVSAAADATVASAATGSNGFSRPTPLSTLAAVSYASC
jgi:hypothetical protein